jgi:2-C-methyl-D-erythritol 4-phosphate cytidylyltransferase/2-C-methyl-D-erythritol 2,4-cyclodiphosphate synthase
VSDLVAVIIPAGGSGVRLGSTLPKALVQIAGKTLVEHAVNRMAPIASQIIVAAPLGFEDEFRKILGDEITVVTGGVTRTESVKAALTHIDASHDFVLVHDAARALAPTSLAMRVVDSLRAGEKAVVPGVAVSDTIKRIDKDNYVTKTPTRSKLRAIQTPQGFKRKVLIAAHKSKDEMTDDAGLVEERGVSVKVIAGEPEAFKITTPDDLALALKYLVGGVNEDMRAGVGTDAHAFSTDPSRPLWLAGIKWVGEVGVDGHSDGDVAAHAICDALLSAASLGDLGSNFGTDRPEYAGASGAKLLQETLVKISAAGFSINNVSVQIVGNRPKIGARRAECISALSTALGGAAVSVSATTTDGLGFTGEGKGLSAIATALIIRSNK